ncbi:mechanosensitive ion channel family protein [Halalkalibaculum sp. DA3122]|uniref:mechanosensitive ion channel family protein n=1 Tax=Halalkalibaculum sp. DA3122 TaxID=3373607 RepID=UPI0037548FBA
MDSTAVSNFAFENIITDEFWVLALRVAIILAVGFPVLFIIRRWARSFFTKRYASHYGMLAGKIVFYTGLTLLAIMVMGQLGLSLAPLLGAAGILGVALGFASQTSVSNIISGLFLIAEQPFKVDDIITVGTTTGIVMSIDMLSVKLRTFDNQFVRIPNETIIKTEVTNLTRFPIRRFDALVSVAYKEDIGEVREVLMQVAEKNEYTLSEPEPQVIFNAFGASSIDLQLRVWGQSSEFLLLKNSIHEEVKRHLDEANIEIPFPHVSLYSGEATGAIPIEIKSEDHREEEEKSNQ